MTSTSTRLRWRKDLPSVRSPSRRWKSSPTTSLELQCVVLKINHSRVLESEWGREKSLADYLIWIYKSYFFCLTVFIINIVTGLSWIFLKANSGCSCGFLVIRNAVLTTALLRFFTTLWRSIVWVRKARLSILRKQWGSIAFSLFYPARFSEYLTIWAQMSPVRICWGFGRNPRQGSLLAVGGRSGWPWPNLESYQICLLSSFPLEYCLEDLWWVIYFFGLASICLFIFKEGVSFQEVLLF